jgi:glycosyltransferase involved in cell wall biosynthesis
MKKVVHLISTDIFAGAENVACQIIKSFSNDNKYDMVYLSMIGDNKESLESRNIKYYHIKKFNYFHVKKALNEINPDIIHAHDIKASIIASLFSKKYEIISHVHSNHENMRKVNLKTVLFNVTSKKYKKIIWVSKSALSNYSFKNRVISKSKVLYNVIDTNEVDKKIIEDNNMYKYDLIYLGRLTYPKNPIRLINIINEITQRIPNLKVAIVGSGDMNDDVTKEIIKYNLQENIILYGFVSNPYKILNSSKVMIMTSRYEGTPMCALEAIACGLPIVSTSTDGLREIVKNNITGFLSNNDNELVDAIVSLLSDNKRYLSMKDEVLKFSLEVNDVNKYKSVIDSIYK